jgi:hypothetical protein
MLLLSSARELAVIVRRFVRGMSIVCDHNEMYGSHTRSWPGQRQMRMSIARRLVTERAKLSVRCDSETEHLSLSTVDTRRAFTRV